MAVLGPFAPVPEWELLSPEAGVSLRHGWWRADGEARGTCVLAQGRTEFAEKYLEVVAELQARGFDVFTCDWRGQGGSTRALANRHKGHIDDYRTYLADFHAWLALAVRPRAQPGLPWVLMGHSLGGHLGLRYMSQHSQVFSAAVLTAPMVDIRVPVARVAMPTLCRLAVRLGRAEEYVVGTGDYGKAMTAFRGNALTADPARFARMHDQLAAAPDLALGGLTWGWLDAAFRSIARLHAAGVPEALTPPTLFVAGAEDRVVDNRAMAAWAARMPHAELVTLAGSRHEPLMEVDAVRAAFWRAFDAFVAPVSAN